MTRNDEKKERVIHTRISESLEEELKGRASSLGVSVSKLVRNVLQNTFGLVEDIVSDSASVARSARGDGPIGSEAPAASAAAQGGAVAPGRIIGWQPLILDLDAPCQGCNAILPKGSEAAVAVTDGAGPRLILCGECLEKRSRDHD